MKKLVFVPILFFASFLVVLYVIVPNYSESSALQKQIEEKEQELREKQAYFAGLKKIAESLTEYQEFLDKIEKALPQEVSLASLLSFFQNKALASGLIMEDISPCKVSTSPSSQNPAGEGAQPAAEEEKIKETGFSLSVSGAFASFEGFLALLEKSSRLIEVESISFGEGEVSGEGMAEGMAEEGELTFDFDLAVKVYSY